MQKATVLVPEKDIARPTRQETPDRTDLESSVLERVRRLDWRFLLPDPRLRAVGFCGRQGSVLHCALNEFSDRVTELSDGRTKQPALQMDLLVLESTHLDQLSQAFDCLKPGGHVYLEWRRRQWLTRPVKTARRLQNAGFRGVKLHWHRPGFGSCLDMVPLHQKVALRHVFSRKADSLKGMFQRLAGWLVTQFNLATFLFRDISIIAEKPAFSKDEVQATGPCHDSVSEFLAVRKLGEDAVETADGENLTSVFVTPRFKASAHVIVFMLSNQTGETVLVAKVPRLAGNDQRLQDEVVNLDAVQALTPNGTTSVPRVLAFQPFRGYRLLVETAVSGQTMRPAFVRRNKALCLRKGLAWITELHRTSRQSTAGRSVALAQALARVTEPLTPLAKSGDLDANLLARTEQQIELLASAQLPLVFEHGDFSSPNILISDDHQIGVVDWELACSAGLPALDLFFFISYVAFAEASANTPGEYLRAFQGAFFGDSPWARPLAQEYCASMALEPELLQPLFVACWSRYVGTLVTRLLVFAGDSNQRGLTNQAAQWLRENRYYQMWRYSIEHLDELNLEP